MIGEVLRKDLIFDSLDPVSITDKTDDIAEIVDRSGVKYGFLDVFSPHTTLGLFVNELTPNLVIDYVNASLKIPEDVRSTWFTENRIPWFIDHGYNEPIPTYEYRHECGENPFLPAEELDKDFNAGRHLRAIKFTSSIVRVPIDNSRLD